MSFAAGPAALMVLSIRSVCDAYHWDALDEDISVDGLLTLNYTTLYRP
ncbi:DUF2442 domain-containing protein [Pantoea ananatis]